jgi:outer membrane protein assembly factor BamA
MTIPVKIQRLFPTALLFCILLFSNYFSAAQYKYRLIASCVDKENTFLVNELSIQTEFISQQSCMDYVNKLPGVLQTKGFVTASMDSIVYGNDTASMVLYIGRQYKWAKINTKDVDAEILTLNGWNERLFSGKAMDLEQMKSMQERTLNYLENNGYPFSKIYLENLLLDEDSVSASLIIEKGPLYKIDSIRLFGKAKLANNFLQRYLDIRNGSIYKKDKLLSISKKILELPYVEEEHSSNMSLLGTGSVLNLYLKPKQSSQINALIGILPNSNQSASGKLMITGEANVQLRNAFGNGESVGLNWQQLQVSSPRLNLYYQHPYVFSSPVGLDLAFDMFRKDSSYLNINLNAGARYVLSESQSGKLFIQNFQTIISQGGINETQVIANRRLPDIIDLNAILLGVEFEKNKTNYRFNPRNGYEFKVSGASGTKKIKKNNEIVELKDPSDPGFDFETLYDTLKLKSYQIRLSGTAAKYLPIGKQGTFKVGINGGIFQSDQIFRNELFQIGGYKTLRGFDEESEYVSQYGVLTLEYRYLIGLNSYFFGFTDGAWAGNSGNSPRLNHTYLGAGLGLALETKAGIFNLAWAIGKRDDTPFNLRQSKIHFGFVNFF